MNGGRLLRPLAALLLLLSMAAVGWALWSSDRASHLQGPATLVVTAGGQVWVSVDEHLWRLHADGRLLHDDPVTALGLPGAPSTLNRHPQGGIVASVRDDPTLYLLDEQTARVRGRITPQWPADLQRHGGRAINLDIHPDGRIAIATGGGHTVALFDAQGQWLARSSPDTFRFTNGLWWAGESLWTTDTNRTRMHQLDGRTLAVQQTDALSELGPERFLGPARRHAQDPQRAALIRFRNGMVQGRVAELRGSPLQEEALTAPPALEPVDLDWLGDEVLVSDGHGFALWRLAAGRPAMPFGHDTVRQRLTADRDARDFGRQQWRLGLGAAAALLVAALAVLAVARARPGRSAEAASSLDLSALGTPQLPRAELWRLQLRVFGPWLLILLPWLALQEGRRWGLLPTWRPPVAWWVLGAMGVVTGVIGIWIAVRHLRLTQDPRCEPAFNAVALGHLRRSATLAQTLQPGEQLLETFVWLCPTLHWAVLTDRRLLIFVATLTDHRLVRVLPLHDITAGSTTRPRSQAWRRLQGEGWLALQFSDGSRLRGPLPSPAVALRVRQHLRRLAAEGALPDAPPAPAGATMRQAARARSTRHSRVAVTLASLLLPGLGQWWQGRSRIALTLFLPWALLITFVALPLAWTLDGPRADVAPSLVLSCAVAWLCLAVVAAFEAWRMVAPPR